VKVKKDIFGTDKCRYRKRRDLAMADKINGRRGVKVLVTGFPFTEVWSDALAVDKSAEKLPAQ